MKFWCPVYISIFNGPGIGTSTNLLSVQHNNVHTVSQNQLNWAKASISIVAVEDSDIIIHDKL